VNVAGRVGEPRNVPVGCSHDTLLVETEPVIPMQPHAAGDELVDGVVDVVDRPDSVQVVAHQERMSAVRLSVATVQVRSGVVRNMPD
jgi:hypothetical protein